MVSETDRAESDDEKLNRDRGAAAHEILELLGRRCAQGLSDPILSAQVSGNSTPAIIGCTFTLILCSAM